MTMKKGRSKRLLAVLLCTAMMLTSNISTLAEGETTETPATAVSAETQAPVGAEQPEVMEAPETVKEPVASQEPVTPVEPVAPAEESAPVEQGNTENTVEPGENPSAEGPVQIPVLEYEDEQIKATVTADAVGVIPEGVTLKVVPITADDKETKEQYKEVGKKLQEKVDEEEKEVAGYLAYDITLIDANGNKVEPNGNVKVSMEYKKAELPREVAEQELTNVEVTVHHLEEDAFGEVQKVVDMGAEKKATVDTLSTEEGEKVKKVEAETESFSIFTITWKYGLITEKEATLDINLVDESGKSIRGNIDKWNNSNKITKVTEIEKMAGVDEDYSFIKAIYGTEIDQGIEIDEIQHTLSWGHYEWQYKTNGKWEKIEVPNKIYFVYKHDPLTISITDNVATTETLDAKLSRDVQIKEYKWYRSDSEAGEYTEVIKQGQGSQANLLDNGLKLHVGNDNGVGMWYKVKAISSRGKEIESAPYQVPNYIMIKDDIINTGSLNAVFGHEVTDEIAYEWYKSDSADGQYTKVEKIYFKDNRSNLSENGDKLYPAYDVGSRKWYKVKAKIKQSDDKEIELESQPFQVPYYDEVQNGGFEAIQYEHHVQVTNKDYKEKGIWQSTGVGRNGTSIEIVTTKENGGLGDYTWKGDAVDGEDGDGTTQFAEINCDAAGALYQDVLTVQGQQLNYWLSHRARGNNYDAEEWDEMYLVIMPTKTAVDNNLDTQDQLDKYLGSIGVNLRDTMPKSESANILQVNDEKVRVVRITSNDQQWHKIRGEDHVYLPTSNLTRFFFMSGRTAQLDGSNKPTLGNFVDGIGFTQNLPPAEEGKFNLTIKKKFEGLGDDQLKSAKEKLQFKISAKNNNQALTGEKIQELLESGGTTKSNQLILQEKSVLLNATDMTEDAFGNLSVSFENRSIGTSDSIYEFTVEEIGKELSGYTVTTKSKATVKQDQTAGTPVEKDYFVATVSEVKGKSNATVEFTNNYRSDNSKVVNFTKVWDDGDNKFITRPESLDVTLKATVTYINAQGQERFEELTKEQLELNSMTATLTEKGQWATSWTVPVYYKVEGTDARVPIQYSVEEGAIGGDYVYSAGSLQEGEIKHTPREFDKTLVEGEGSAQTTVTSPKKMMKSKSTSNSTNPSNKDIGEPSHNKYVTYNKNTDDYTLNLDVTGKKGEQEGVDVLFVIDTSGSMSSNGWFDKGLLFDVKKLLAQNADNAIDQILGEKGNVNSAAYVSFAGKDETRTSSWYDYNTKDQMKEQINKLRATGGTNWTYAMMKANDMLEARANSGNEKVVIFLSDGEPTFSINKRGREYGHGNYTEKVYYDEAISKVTDSAALKQAKMYSVYLTKGTAEGMTYFASEINKHGGNAEAINGVTNLSEELQGILNKIIPTYEGVVIEDTLSEYVVFSEGTPNVTVTKKTATGTTVLTKGTHYDIETSGNKVKVSFKGELDDAATYTISFRIKPSEKAEDEFNGEYPNTGESATGASSAGQKGYFSNKGATLTYSIKGTDKQNIVANYPSPVIQVNTHNLTFNKVWANPEKKHPESVKFEVTYTDGTKGTVELRENENWTKTITKVPTTRKIQGVKEILPKEYEDAYTPSYEISTDGKTVTVTNSYSKIETQNITVKKEWVGNGPQTEVKVGLYYTDKNSSKPTLHEKVTLNANNKWEYVWKNLEVPEGRVYAIREESIPSNYTSNIIYSTSEDGTTTIATIKNVYDQYCADENYYIVNTLQTTPITITKVWDDDDNSQAKRPATLGVTVQEGNHNLQFTLSGEGNVWSENARVLKRKDNTYSASENIAGAVGYEMTDYAISNVKNSVNVAFTNKIKTQTITVTKNWIDTFKSDTDRPGSIRFRVLKDNEEYGTYLLTADDKDESGKTWTKVIENLPVGAYTVEEYTEEDDPKYDYSAVNSIATDDGNGHFTLMNKINWHIVKTTHAIDGAEGKPLEGAEFQLKQGDNIIATGISNQQGLVNWAVNESIDLTKLNGDYTLVETKAPAGYMINSSGWKVTFDENGILTGGINLADQKELNLTATKENGIRVSVENLELYELPSTGGSGIFWYVIGGTLLMLAAVLLLYRKNRYKRLVK